MKDTTPFERMEQLFEQMRREMYGDVGGDWSRTGWWTPTETGRLAIEDGEFDTDDRTAIRLEHGDDDVVVIADLPGFEREEIDLHVSDGHLVIDASHDVEDDSTYRRRRVHERISLPEHALFDEAQATYQNGVLEIHFPLEGDDADRTPIDIE